MLIRSAQSKRPISSRWLPGIIAGTFATSVIALAAMSVTGKLGDGLYGGILMSIMTIPISIVEIAAGLFIEWLNPYLLTNIASLWVSLLAPGLLEAMLLWWLLRRGQRSASGVLWGKLAAFSTSLLVIFSGVALIIDQYVPRRAGGIPLIILGVLQALLAFIHFRNIRLHARASSDARSRSK